jgi:hypothetical protein
MGKFNELRGDVPFSFVIPATAAGTAYEQPLIKFPFQALVTEIVFVPGAAMTANASNFCTLTLRNRTTGAGTVSFGNRAWSATNSVATTPETLTLSSTASDLFVALGDVLTAHVTHTGTGLALPISSVTFKIRSR